MSISVSRVSISNIVGNLVLFGGLGSGLVNVLPKKKSMRSKSDLVWWAMDKAVRRETNLQLVARRKAKNQLFSK